MPNNLRPARSSRTGLLRAIVVVRLVQGVAFAASLGTHALAAQRPAAPIDARDLWSIDMQYLQLNASTLPRHATPSLGVTLGRDIIARASGVDMRLEAGWLRAARPDATAQGATIGLSAGFGLPGSRGSAHDGSAPSRLVLRPGIAVLAGWAESQDSSVFYQWRGAPSTAAAGTTGTQFSSSTTRGRSYGAGVSLGAELRLSNAIGLSGSIRRWSFSGDAFTSRRNITMGGVGIVARPNALVSGVRRLLHAASPAHQDASSDGDVRTVEATDAKHATARSPR